MRLRRVRASRTAVLVALVVVLAACVRPAGADSEEARSARAVLLGRVVEVIDGDTFDLRLDFDRDGGGKGVRIRLAEIDAPELAQPYGAESRAALRALIGEQQVRVTVVDTDRYGRTVGQVRTGALHVNAEMVRRGHAWAYTRYAETLDIIADEQAARRAGVGLWALPLDQREPPWEWRRGHRGTPRSSPQDCTAVTPVEVVCGSKRNCGQMTSCADACAHLRQCGLRGLDGDGDGVPCERLCRGR